MHYENLEWIFIFTSIIALIGYYSFGRELTISGVFFAFGTLSFGIVIGIIMMKELIKK